MKLALGVPLRLRLLFRASFALLAAATLALALTVLQDERQRGQAHYAETLKRTLAQAAARLRHPTGQLALLNPGADAVLQPLVLPYSALDFDDRAKAQQAVEMAGCAMQYPDGSSLCVAVGHNPYAGGFLYLVGALDTPPLQAHTPGVLDLATAHRVAVQVDYRGEQWRWIAPYELSADGRGRLTAFDAGQPVTPASRPVRDFRGWWWLESRCADEAASAPDCLRRSFLSVRLPVEVFREALQRGTRPVWPPPDLGAMRVSLRVLPPGEGAPLFDSAAPGAVRPWSLDALRDALNAGERLTVRAAGESAPRLVLDGPRGPDEPVAPWLERLVRRLPAEAADPRALVLDEAIVTPFGRHELQLAGDPRSVDRALAATATRLSGFVAAILAAILVTWLALEIFIMRRVTRLTRRAAAVIDGMRGGAAPEGVDFADLRGGDELGVLARGLDDLLRRVHADLGRERIRVQQERDMWHAVGHEIVSPLQSLMALTALQGGDADPARRYVARMQQAVRVLYGEASPSEAFEATQLQLAPLDLDAFLAEVAANARYIDIDDVRFAGTGAPLSVRADASSLEEVVTHVLRNAARHRAPGTAIEIRLSVDGRDARFAVANRGEAIPEDLLPRIFEYGVSGAAPDAAGDDAGRRGQGLFVARTYMAKMGGTIAARNVDGGVVFEMTLPRA